jgi:hypothetical protein
VPGALGRHRAPIELAREADGEVADVDHLLHLTERLGRDLPKGLSSDDVSLGGHPHDGRLDIVGVRVARRVAALAADEDFAAVRHGLFERRLASYDARLISGPTSVPCSNGSPIAWRSGCPIP